MRKRTVMAGILTILTATSLWANQQPPMEGSNLGNVKGGDFKMAHAVIEKKCTACHSAKRISEAFAAGKDMVAIQKAMEKKGAKLSSNERDVLGIYWRKSPLKEKK